MSGNFIVYLIGYVIAIIGVGYGLSAAGLATEWIVAVVLVMVGLGIVYALSRSQQDKTTDNSQTPTHSESRETIIQRDVPTETTTRTVREEPPPPRDEPRH